MRTWVCVGTLPVPKIVVDPSSWNPCPPCGESQSPQPWNQYLILMRSGWVHDKENHRSLLQSAGFTRDPAIDSQAG